MGTTAPSLVTHSDAPPATRNQMGTTLQMLMVLNLCGVQFAGLLLRAG